MPAAARDSLSVVLPTRDRPGMLADSIASLLEVLGPGDELVVVDSCSRGDGTAAAAAAAGVRSVRAPVKGASVARNLGWRVATHDLIAFIDDDVRVGSGWADAMVAALNRPGVGFVTGRVGTPAGQEDTARAVAQIRDDEPRTLDRTVTGNIGHSANLGAHRWALALVGGFDERLGPGHPWIAEDYDLFDRWVQSGVEGRYDPSVQAVHEQWRNHGQRLVLDWHYALGSGVRLSKVLRLDRSRLRIVSRHVLREWLLAGLVNDTRAGSRIALAHTGVQVAGLVCGFVAGITTPLEGGHLAAVRAAP